MESFCEGKWPYLPSATHSLSRHIVPLPLVNASSLVVGVDEDHWLIGNGRGLVRPVVIGELLKGQWPYLPSATHSPSRHIVPLPLVNASSLVAGVDEDHWLEGGGRGLVKPVGRVFHMSYAIFSEGIGCSLIERRPRPPCLTTNGCSLSGSRGLRESIRQFLANDMLPTCMPLYR